MLRDWSDRITTPARRVPPALQHLIGGVLTLAMLFLLLLPFM